ncbi:hypothetical protein APA44_21535 [Pseudomonas aeruginosa]|uniref:hypothetical protein n=1 Tax=Pseudomonas aeruginosa TaxID=287 RepID=UPI0005B947B3|nr:hypothetical protein [Pseudomonas aeruginosa]KSL08987.1 hypothetical protein APA44_21535 [Pseudomonas aeruginosa]MBH9340376.1 hypothetical protein [Pseudomonas aeruginosa]MBH9398234.1 hypothetical protein [Pseudomonas aeruginosa]HCF7143612.1 hypothetical protein [Pseudomonas aeruginosa]
MSKHTPGPWQWSHGRLLHNVPGEYSDTILDIQDKVWRPTEEDARLIAAAPDLLEALQACIQQITALCSADDVPDQARAAIAKATA